MGLYFYFVTEKQTEPVYLLKSHNLSKRHPEKVLSLKKYCFYICMIVCIKPKLLI